VIDANEIWEALYSIMEGDVPDEMTEGVCERLADWLSPIATPVAEVIISGLVMVHGRAMSIEEIERRIAL